MRLLQIIAVLGLTLGFTTGAELRIRGLRTLSEQDALDIMGGRLTYIKSRPATPARADDAAFILERLLKTRGYTDAEVTWTLEGTSRIILTINEGSPSLLGSVRVSGIESPEITKTAGEQFRSAHDAESQLSSQTPYLPNKNTEGIANVTAYLQSLGYWDAQVTLADAGRDASSGLIQAHLEARPGVLYRLAIPRVETEGVRQPEVEDRLISLANNTATAAQIRKIRLHVAQHYRNRGYQFAKVDMFAEYSKGFLALTFKVKPGRQYSVGEIEIAGTEKVQKEELDRRFHDYLGKEYQADDIEDEIRKLYGTGAFESVQLETSPQDDGTLDLVIRVEEAKPDGYYAYGGVGSLEGPILGGGYYHRNLFGNLWNFSSGLEISGIGLLGDVRVTEPWFLGQDLRFTPRVYAQTRSYDGFSKAELGAGAELAWDFDNEYSANLSFYTSYVTTDPDGIAVSELGPNDYVLNRLAFEQTVDQRNNPTLPTNGYFARLNNELGLTFGDGSISYFRTDARLSIYQPVFTDSHLAFNTQAGLLIPTGESDELPIDLRYFLGGASTVRSFPERELGPLSNGFPRGGEAYWIANLEYIQKLKGLLSGVAFVDAGNLNESFEDFGGGRTNFAAGLGLRLDLPIGPVRLEYGRNLNQAGSEPSGAFHFAIGTTF